MGQRLTKKLTGKKCILINVDWSRPQPTGFLFRANAPCKAAKDAKYQQARQSNAIVTLVLERHTDSS
jgi:hypothetical protein